MSEAYESLFSRYGSRSDEAEVRFYGYFTRPEKLTQERVQWYDQRATQMIRECEECIEVMKEYRQKLAARYADLATAPYHMTLTIKRWHQDHGIRFTVELLQVYEDGTKVEQLREVYTGKERRTAIARYEELKKQHPGIEATADIEKQRWER